MRERWCGAIGARSPGPQHERVALHVLDNLLSAPTATVPSWVLHFLTDLRLGQPLPLHRQGCQVPGRDARNDTVGCVRRLVACLTLLGGRAVAVLPTDHEWLMKDGSIRLPWRIVLVTVHASRVHDDARYRIELRRACGLRCGAGAESREQKEDGDGWRTRGALDRRANPCVSPAPAVVARQGLIDIRVGGRGDLGEQRRGGHDLAGLTVTALDDLEIEPCLLDLPATWRGTDPLDRGDRVTDGGAHRHHARAARTTIDVHRARATQRSAAAELGPSHGEQVAQHPQQRHVRGRVHRVIVAVDFQCNHRHPSSSVTVAAPPLVYDGYNWSLTGSRRMRFPVAAWIAFATAGMTADVPGSPIPPGASPLATR